MKKNSKIAISAISKNDLEYLSEWIDYHLDIGVDQIVLYDNNEKPILHEYLSSYIEKGGVEVYNWSTYQSTGRQTRSQADCLIRHKYHFDWIGLIDTDEFVVLLDDDTNIKNYLNQPLYKMYDAIALSWLMFGSNNHKQKQKSVIDSYTQSCPQSASNSHIKCFVRPKGFIRMMTPHGAITKKGTVNVDGELLKNIFGARIKMPEEESHVIIDRKMRINHYYTKSLEDWQNKKKRGGGEKADRVYKDYSYDMVNQDNVFNDEIIKLHNRIKEKKCNIT